MTPSDDVHADLESICMHCDIACIPVCQYAVPGICADYSIPGEAIIKHLCVSDTGLFLCRTKRIMNLHQENACHCRNQVLLTFLYQHWHSMYLFFALIHYFLSLRHGNRDSGCCVRLLNFLPWVTNLAMRAASPNFSTTHDSRALSRSQAVLEMHAFQVSVLGSA